MRRLLASIAVVLAASASCQAEWSTSLDEAEKESKEKGKLLLVYIWAPTCHVCKKLNEVVWPNIAVETELENWAAAKIDSAIAVQSHYHWKIDDVPDIRIIDPEGNEFRRLGRGALADKENVENILSLLKQARDDWDKELAGRVFEWEASPAEAKTKARERQRAIAYFFHDDEVPAKELSKKYPQFTDRAATVPSKKFVCVSAGKDVKEAWEKYKPVVVPGFVFVDLDGNEIHRCGLLSAPDLAKEMETAVAKFEPTLVVDPAKAMERDLARWEAALKTDKEQDKLDAAQKLIDTKDPKVVKPLAAGFRDPSVKLKELLIQPMLQIDIKTGLPILLQWVVKETNNKLAVKGWDAIGETGDLRAVAALEDDVLEAPSAEVSNARIRALGNMKHKDVVTFLIDLPFTVKTKGRGPGGGGGVRNTIKNSLNRLTGQDFGEDWLGWKKWWRDNQRSFKFPE